PDERSLQLRHEMHQLAEDVREHRTLYLPSLDRDIDDADRIIERVNDMSINEFAAKRRNVK
ncbi:MAG TPA: hypothetical protein VH144_01765, partial [Candidatus Saccharimonadales bacterium]|nr:hypothetical protein [Candidatus Saccharimonadales bacterium]